MKTRLHGLPVVCAGLFLSACGGGGSTATPPPVQLEPLSIASVNPNDGATGVARATVFSATFNRAVDPASADGNSVKLLGPDGNPIPGNVVVSGADVQFVPAASALPGGSTYTASMSTQLKGTSGGSLGVASMRSFTTTAQVWDQKYSVAVALNAFTGGTSPQAVVDKAGNVTAIWASWNGSSNSIFSVRKDGKTGIWGAVSTVFALAPSGLVSELQTAVSGNGDVFVSWVTDAANGLPVVQLARYNVVANTWGVPEQVTTLPSGLSQMGFAFSIDSAANVMILSTAITGLSSQTGAWMYGLYATRYDVATGKWTAPKNVETLGTDSMEALKMVVDGAGNVTAAWVSNRFPARVLEATRYSAATATWSPTKIVDPQIQTGVPSNYSLGVDLNGQLTMLSPHQNMQGGKAQIHASRFDPASGNWSAPTQLDDGNGANLGAVDPQVVVNSAGYATAFWNQSDGLYSARFSPSTGTWSAARKFANGAVNAPPAITMDVAGNANAMYVENRVDGFKVMAVSYSANSRAWDSPVIIDLPPSGTTVFANPPVAVVSPSGTATALWFAQTTLDGATQYGLVAQQFR